MKLEVYIMYLDNKIYNIFMYSIKLLHFFFITYQYRLH